MNALIATGLAFVIVLMGFSVGGVSDPDPDGTTGPAGILATIMDRALVKAPAEEQEALARLAEAGAFHSVLYLTGEKIATRENEALWEESQARNDPDRHFEETARQRSTVLRGEIVRGTEDLVDVPPEGLPALRLEAGLLSAHLFVGAELSLRTGESLLEQAAADPSFRLNVHLRYVVMRAIVVAEVLFDASRFIAEESTNLPDNGPIVERRALSAVVEHAGGVDASAWGDFHGGGLHSMARHMHHAAMVIQEEHGHGNVTVIRDGLAQSVQQAEIHIERMREQGFSAVRLEALRLDSEWWLGRLAEQTDEDNLIWFALLDLLHAWMEAATHENDILVNALEHGARETPSPPVVGLLIAVAAFLGIARRTRLTEARDAGRRRFLQTVATGSCVVFLVGATLVMAGSHGWPEESVTFTEAEDDHGPGDLAVTSDGVVHFVWAENRDDEGEGNLILYRSYDTKTEDWTAIRTLKDKPPTPLALPRLHAHDDTIQFFWVERPNEDSSILKWCMLEIVGSNPECGRTVSLGTAVRFGWPEVAFGQDRTLHAAWEERSSDAREIVYRAKEDGGWGPPLRFVTGSSDQRDPAIAVQVDGTVHVAWRDQHPNSGVSRIMHATVAPGASEPSSPQRIEGTTGTRGSAFLLAHEGEVHIAYGAPVDGSGPLQLRDNLYHRYLKDDSWSDPYNVSRTDADPFHPFLIPHRDGGIVAGWVNNQASHIAYAVRDPNGFWTQPDVLISLTHSILLQFVETDQDGGWHFTWTYFNRDEVYTGMKYLGAKPVIAEHPPEVVRLDPANGTWTNNAGPLPVTATLALGAPLDESGTYLEVDGQRLNHEASSGYLVAETTPLDEGIHEAVLVLGDKVGRVTETAWWFGVDRTPPHLDWAVLNRDGPVEGWVSDPVRVEAEVDERGGSPARAQIQLDGEFWYDMKDSKMKIPQGELHTVRVRAIDVAGNVNLGERVTVGWDPDPPRVEYRELPYWTSADPLSLWFSPAEGESGSPITVHAAVYDGDKRIAESQAPLDTGRIEFDVPEGTFEIHAWAIDEADNQSNMTIQTVGVDRTPPRLEVDHKNDTEGVRIIAEDNLSGISAIQVAVQGEIVHEEIHPEGTLSAQVELDIDDETLVVRVTDHAGNQATDGDGFPADAEPEETNQPENETSGLPDRQDSGRDGPLGDRTETTPVAGWAILVTAIIVLGLARRRRAPSALEEGR